MMMVASVPTEVFQDAVALSNQLTEHDSLNANGNAPRVAALNFMFYRGIVMP